jgi:2-polyprenyl-3-methyl-5-hydroxy-6-metoxy-1,4-benzoquinol methylase
MNEFNMTRLIPDKQWQVHRDYIAHCLRWDSVTNWLRKQKGHGEDVIVWDIGCGEGHLLKTIHANRVKVKKYIGIDVHHNAIKNAVARYNGITMNGISYDFWEADFTNIDLVDDILHDGKFKPHLITNFEVLEHLPSPTIASIMLNNMSKVLDSDGHVWISTPTRFGANDPVTCKNHLFEYTQDGLSETVSHYFDIEHVYGTMMYLREYLKHSKGFNRQVIELIDVLREHFSSNVLSAFLAPAFPELSRSQLIIAKSKEGK